MDLFFVLCDDVIYAQDHSSSFKAEDEDDDEEKDEEEMEELVINTNKYNEYLDDEEEKQTFRLFTNISAERKKSLVLVWRKFVMLNWMKNFPIKSILHRIFQLEFDFKSIEKNEKKFSSFFFNDKERFF